MAANRAYEGVRLLRMDEVENLTEDRLPMHSPPSFWSVSTAHISTNDLSMSSWTPEKTLVDGAERVHAIDNLRTVLVVLLVFRHAVLETIATVSEDYETLFPKQYRFLNLFVGVGMNVTMGMLFFVSGHGSSVSMVAHSRTPQHFALRKTIRTMVLAVAGYVAANLIAHTYGPWPVVGDVQMSYYALQSGKHLLLQGPIFYLLLLLTFDYIYAISRAISTCWGPNTKSYFTSELRYNLSKYTVIIILEIWTICIAGGMIRPPSILSPLIEYIHPAPHVPMQYAIGYLAGIHFTSFSGYLANENPPHVAILTVAVRVFLSSSTLFALCRRFPKDIIHFVSLKDAPQLSVDLLRSSTRYHGLFVALYGLWSASTFILLATPLAQLFLTSRRLNKDWGIVSRATILQPFIHMFFVIAFSRAVTWTDNLALKSLVVGVGSAVCGWLGTSVLIIACRSLYDVFLPYLFPALFARNDHRA